MLKYTMHNHTYRCKHALGDEDDMIKQAISDGFEIVGISDHVAYPISATMYRMEYEEKDDYLNILDNLKDKYKNEIIVYRGFEAEYQIRYIQYLADLYLDNKIDYLALGQHYYDVEKPETYHGNIYDSRDLYVYVDQCIEAMKSGLFLFFAHPDLCFNYIGEFDEECIKQTTRLIDAAIQYDFPLEYNAGGLRSLASKDNDAYPRNEFWQIAASKNAKCVVNADAHTPQQINDKYYQLALKQAQELNLNILDNLDIEKHINKIRREYKKED